MYSNVKYCQLTRSSWNLEIRPIDTWSHFPEGRRFYLPALAALAFDLWFLWRPNWGISFDLRKLQDDLVFLSGCG